MGICTSSKNKNQVITINGEPVTQGLPPQNVIPQPVELVNHVPELNNQIKSTDNNIENTQNQIVNSINSSNQPIIQVGNQSLDNNIDLLPKNSQNINIINDQTLPESHNIINNNQILGQSQPKLIYPFNNSQQDDNNYKRVYLVVQMPQREIEITKLYGFHALLDIEPFIAPDSLDEYEIYDCKGYSINDYLYTPFKDWINVDYTLRIRLIREGLNIAHDIRKYISQRTYLISCLMFDTPNTLGLFIFNKMNNSTLCFVYSTNVYSQLKTINQFSSYCNALDKLYISGGEIEKNFATNAFLCLDLEEIQQNKFYPTQLCNLIKGRYWHSMIFIPEKYIFILGGPNETMVELYDIEKNISRADSKLNIDRCEPSLILVNNKFLYAFFGFHLYENFIDSIERCNIYKRTRTWEIVDYKLNNTPNLVRGFFGVSYISNNILLINDKETQNDLKPNYILYPGTGNIDTICEEGILNSKNPRLFPEKFFIPFSEKESINLAFKSGEPKIFIVNNENGEINELCFDEAL